MLARKLSIVSALFFLGVIACGPEVPDSLDQSGKKADKAEGEPEEETATTEPEIKAEKKAEPPASTPADKKPTTPSPAGAECSTRENALECLTCCGVKDNPLKVCGCSGDCAADCQDNLCTGKLPGLSCITCMVKQQKCDFDETAFGTAAAAIGTCAQSCLSLAK